MPKFIEERPNRFEVLDYTPIAVPIGMKRPESMHDMITRIIGNKFADIKLDSETETFEESEDFEIDDDDYDPSSPWEEVFEPKTGDSLGFLETNRAEKVYPKSIIYERRLDDRTKSYPMGEDNNSSDGSVQGDSIGSDGQRS